MNVYRKIMGVVVWIEKIILALSFVLVLVLTFGNVVARKVFAHSWGFTEEIVVAMFVLLSLLGVGVAARKSELVGLSLLTDNVSPGVRKVFKLLETVFCVGFSLILTWQGIDRMMVDHTFSPILHIPKAWFWGFVVVGGISMILHFLESCITFFIPEKESK